MTHSARTILALLIGCALCGAACDTRTSTPAMSPSPAMSPAAMPAPPAAARVQLALAAFPGAP